MNLNQGLSIALVVLGVFVVSTAQLTDLFGPNTAKTIVSVSGLSMAILSGILGVLTGQVGQAKATASLPGAQIVVGRNASPALAALAMDPTQPNIVPAPGAEAALQQKM